MKIVIINSAWYGGGAETVARECYLYFVEKGHECYFAFSRGNIPVHVNGIRIGNSFDIFTHIIAARLFDANGFCVKRATRLFIERIEQINPDIIFIHSLVCYVLNIELFFNYIRTSGRKIVWTLHDCWSFTGHCISFDSVQCNKWMTGCGHCPGRLEYPTSYLIDRSKKNLQRKTLYIGNIKKENLILVTPSQWLANIVKQTYLKKFRCVVINNGIDLRIFKPQKSDIKEKFCIPNNKKIILGVASRWTKGKGLKYFKELNKVIDKDKFQIVIVGIRLIESLSIGDDIIKIRKIKNIEELIKWYSAADIFVNSSIADNFPTVNLESLACGTPVVTFKTGGSWEAVGGDCGVLVKENEVNLLYKCIIKCISKNIYADICVLRAQEFDKRKCFDNYLNLL